MNDKLLIGVHVSIAGCIANAPARAAALGCTTFQIFPSTPRGWRQKPLADDDARSFREECRRLSFDTFFIHIPYLPNISNPDDAKYERSVAALVDAIERTARLGGGYVVTHMGSHLGAGIREGRRRAGAALERALAATPGADIMVLMENAAGKANVVGGDFVELGRVYEGMGKRARRRVGLCLDTCHAHAMGYDLSAGGDGLARVLAEVDAVMGLDAIRLIHLNDAKGAAGAGLDRHDHIGKGTIGREGFRRIVNHPTLRACAMVLETPQEEGWDKKNLAATRRLRVS